MAKIELEMLIYRSAKLSSRRQFDILETIVHFAGDKHDNYMDGVTNMRN